MIDIESEIRCDYGNVILNVYKDIYMKNNSVIVAEGDGNVFIKCGGGMYMESGACIRTCTGDKREQNVMGFWCDGGDSRVLHGNVYMLIEDELRMKDEAKIESGDVKIDCGGVYMDKSVKMNAFRNNICIKAKGKMNIDIKMWDNFKANKQKIFVENGALK